MTLTGTRMINSNISNSDIQVIWWRFLYFVFPNIAIYIAENKKYHIIYQFVQISGRANGNCPEFATQSILNLNLVWSNLNNLSAGHRMAQTYFII